MGLLRNLSVCGFMFPSEFQLLGLLHNLLATDLDKFCCFHGATRSTFFFIDLSLKFRK